MEYEWYETIRNTACYHQTPFNFVLIAEQLLNNNVELTEEVNMMIAEQNKQRNSSENKKVNRIMRTEAKVFTPNRVCNGEEYDEILLIDDENYVDDADNGDIVEKKENGWTMPKKHVAIEKSLKNMRQN